MAKRPALCRGRFALTTISSRLTTAKRISATIRQSWIASTRTKHHDSPRNLASRIIP